MKPKNTSKEPHASNKRLVNMTDAQIDLSDIPELDESFFKNAKIRLPQKKQSVSLRLDQDTLAWFKDQGKGYQTYINAVLRAYVQAHQN
jgi:uncharacterized protein (DUF4415 family)